MKRRIYCITYATYQRNPAVSRLSTALYRSGVLNIFFVRRRISTNGWRGETASVYPSARDACQDGTRIENLFPFANGPLGVEIYSGNGLTR
jgi:hypothetical protein